MNSQRETDIMLLEAKEYVRKIFEEWLHDYLGSRAEQQTPPEGGAAVGQSIVAQGLVSTPQSNTGY